MPHLPHDVRPERDQGPAGELIRATPAHPFGTLRNVETEAQPAVEGWSVEHVLALAPSASAAGAARAAGIPALWSATGCDGSELWGRYQGSGAEPYHTRVELAEARSACTCPSRRQPCKHALGLLLLWCSGKVTRSAGPVFSLPPLPRSSRWASPAAGPAGALSAVPGGDPADQGPRRSTAPAELLADSPSRPPADRRAAERAARISAGLEDLDRWLADVLRRGLLAEEIGRPETWEGVAARLVDAQAGSLANRIRRIATMVGTRPGWQEVVLAELGVLHLLAEAGRRLPELDGDLAESVRSALGLRVRQADVLAAAGECDVWRSLGCSDTIEDRIVVRRRWLRAAGSARWALVASFSTSGLGLDDGLPLSSAWRGELHRYPGRVELRCAVGMIAEERADPGPLHTSSIAGACEEIGDGLAAVPWVERWPVTVLAAAARRDGRWVLTDRTGSLPIAGEPPMWPIIVAATASGPVPITDEWTAAGLIPLAVHLGERSVDVGPAQGFGGRRSRSPGLADIWERSR